MGVTLAEPLTRAEREVMFAQIARNGEPLDPPWDVLQRYEATVQQLEAALREIEHDDVGFTVGSGSSAYHHECPGRLLARAALEGLDG